MARLSTKIVYLAHTQQRVLDDAVFSILNIIHWGLEETDAEVIVGTDRPEKFDHLPVTVWHVSAEDIKDWKGEIGFIHRTKPYFLHLVAERHSDCHILYFDADTAIKSPLRDLIVKIESDNALMHASEGALEVATMPVYGQIRKALNLGILNLPELNSTEMFNAGVIGVHCKRTSVFTKLIALLDSIYPKLQVHIVEQMLFAYLLGRETKVVDSSLEVIHWWGKGLNTGPIISDFLQKTKGLPLKERAASAARLLPKVEQAPMNPRLTFAQKLRRSIKKRFG